MTPFLHNLHLRLDRAGGDRRKAVQLTMEDFYRSSSYAQKAYGSAKDYIYSNSSYAADIERFLAPQIELEKKQAAAAQQKAEHDRRMAEQQRQAAEQRARAEAEQRRIEAENQRIAQETARRENYGRAMRSGDLAGDDTAPTVISGGTTNVDQSRLSIGGSSRRRRGRGISSQLGL